MDSKKRYSAVEDKFSKTILYRRCQIRAYNKHLTAASCKRKKNNKTALFWGQ